MPNLKKGDLVTIIDVSDWLATTTKSTVYATGNYTADGKPIFKESKTKRKQFTLRPFTSDQIVFINSPDLLTTDSEYVHPDGSRRFEGNACYNFMQTPEEIRAIIETSSMNPLFDKHAHILSHATTPAQRAYPELVTSHAIINQHV